MAEREPLLHMLQDYSTSYEVEEEFVSRTIQFVQKNKDCFKRELQEGHITAGALVTDKARDHILLNHHKKLNMWVQFGGHADGDPDVVAVAKKEIFEESGLADVHFYENEEKIFDVDIHQFPEHKGVPAHLHYEIRFLLIANKDEEYVISHESNDLKWIKLADLSKYNQEEGLKRMVEKLSKLKNR
jgi:8-oxo-dGTP pyrophosphatase MutT (NUDIX family)